MNSTLGLFANTTHVRALFIARVALALTRVTRTTGTHLRSLGWIALSVLVSTFDAQIARAQTWGQTQILAPSDGAVSGAYFGWAVDVAGDTAVVGAPAATGPSGPRGAVYVFVRGAGGWTEQARLLAPDAADRFGAAVAISGDSLVVGAPWSSTPTASRSGAAYVFTRSGTSWDAGVRLPASDSLASSEFGSSVTIDGDYVAIGPANTDAVYVFVRGAGGWTQQVRLTRNPFELTRGFGRDVSLSGTTLVIGADLATGPAGTDSGAALVYVRSGSTWTEQAHWYGGDAGNHFGLSVAIEGDLAVIGEPDYAGGYTSVGRAVVYRRTGTTWTRRSSESATQRSGARMGVNVDVSGTTFIVSQFFGAGRIHIYDASSATPGYVGFVTASDAATGDRFGSALAISGNDIFGGLFLGARRQAYVFGLLDDDGAACSASSTCLSGNCVDGVCCNGACGGGLATDCEACSVTAGGAANGSCTTLTAAAAPMVTCRPALDACDAAEACSPASTVCPLDRAAPASTVCRASAGACDLPETCSGASTVCPADAFAAVSRVCRASAGVCDVAETCSGASPACPVDGFASASLVCRGSAGVCDVAETCSGASPACPADAFASASSMCRASVGVCDVAETCTGLAAACPADAASGPGVACGAAPSGACDVQDACVGSVGATARCEARVASTGTPCRAASCSGGIESAAGACDGAGTLCPPSAAVSCAPFVCGASACLSSCTSDADCASGRACLSRTCVVPIADAGVVAADAGPPLDAAIGVDAAVGGPDAGVPVDAGIASLDGGPITLPDSGARDAGPSDGSVHGDGDVMPSSDASARDSGVSPPAPLQAGCACAVPIQRGDARATFVPLLALLGIALERRRLARARRSWARGR